MPKAPKKSWRTINRLATKAKSPAARERLRAEAAALRRAERKTAKAKKRAPKMAKGVKTFTEKLMRSLPTTMQPDEAANNNGCDMAVSKPDTGRMIAGSDMDAHARAILLDARKKKGDPVEAIVSRLATIAAVARYEGQRAAQDLGEQTAARVRKNMQTKIIAGFIAIFEDFQKQNGGLPASSHVNGVTLAAILDVLHEIGYSRAGLIEKKDAPKEWRQVASDDGKMHFRRD